MVGWRSSVRLRSFNPTMVRLLRAGETSMVGDDWVSIPQWCDCCRKIFVSQYQPFLVSIPQWCDCCPSGCGRQTGFSSVSIPQWCDCCCRISMFHSLLMRVSIPQWCDCCAGVSDEALSCASGFNPTMVRLLPLRRLSWRKR